MNLDAIKKKLESMQKTPTGGSNNSSNVKRFKPSIGKQTVRVVPFKYNKEFPFTEMRFYYGIGSKKVIASPLNWGEKDPIAEFAKQLRGTNDKENWRLAKKLDPKVRIYAPVIVRGEESEGVQLWEFGKEIYEAFLQMAADEEVGLLHYRMILNWLKNYWMNKKIHLIYTNHFHLMLLNKHFKNG